MTVTVKLFAAARDLAGREAVVVDVNGNTVAALRIALATHFPKLLTILARSAIAVNHEYADEGKVISEGDEVALIPPVSGG